MPATDDNWAYETSELDRNTGAKRSAISVAVSSLEKELAQLGQTVAELEDRLGPVTASNIGGLHVGNEAVALAPVQPASPHATALRDFTENLASSRRRLGDLLYRLDV